MTNKAKTVKEVLIASKWILENCGWIKGEYSSVKSFCAIGAIEAVVADEHLKSKAEDLLRTTINEDFISQWNDRPTTTKEMVIEMFDRAIEGSK